MKGAPAHRGARRDMHREDGPARPGRFDRHYFVGAGTDAGIDEF